MNKIFHAGNVIIVGFITCALAMIYLAYKTTTVHYDMSVEGDYYTMETSMNKRHAAQRNAINIGKDFRIYQSTDSIYISLPPRISNQVAKGQVEFYCYSNSKEDAIATFASNPSGIYAFGKNTYMKGNNYNVKVSFEVDGQAYYKEAKF